MHGQKESNVEEWPANIDDHQNKLQLSDDRPENTDQHIK